MGIDEPSIENFLQTGFEMVQRCIPQQMNVDIIDSPADNAEHSI